MNHTKKPDQPRFELGARVVVQFDSGEWFHGSVTGLRGAAHDPRAVRVQYDDGEVAWEKPADGAMYALAEDQSMREEDGDDGAGASSTDTDEEAFDVPEHVDMDDIDNCEMFAASTAGELQVVFNHDLLAGCRTTISTIDARV